MGLFALLGFVYVPLGRLTGFEHACAVLATPAASAAIEDVTNAAWGLRRRVVSFATGRDAQPAALEPAAPEPAEQQPPKQRTPRQAQAPRPVPPKLD